MFSSVKKKTLLSSDASLLYTNNTGLKKIIFYIDRETTTFKIFTYTNNITQRFMRTTNEIKANKN